VILSAWRSDGAQQLRDRLEDAQKSGNIQRMKAARDACSRYWAESQKLAFLISFVLALLIAMMGVRGIEMLVGPEVVSSSPAAQQRLFVWVDVFMTALLLAGGAEGMHKLVNAFTTFLDATQEKILSTGQPTAPARTAPSAGGGE
jgi:hypothetical protein